MLYLQLSFRFRQHNYALTAQTIIIKGSKYSDNVIACKFNARARVYTVIWFIFVLKIISVFNFGGDLISFL